MDKLSIRQLFDSPLDRFLFYQAMLSPQKPTPKFKGIEPKDLEEMRFDYVEQMMSSNWEAQDIEEFFCKIYGLLDTQFYAGDCVEFFSCLRWLLESVGSLNDMKIKMSQSAPTKESMIFRASGGDRLEIFGAMNTSMYLGKMFNVLPSTIDETPWIQVMHWMYHDKLYNLAHAEYVIRMRKLNANAH